MSRVLVISPHPDDEAIGCGGALRGHVVAGDTVRVIFLTSGERGGHGRPPQETAKLREQEARAAAQILGFIEVDFWRQPDGAVRVTSQLAGRLAAVLQEWRPELLYVPHEQEMHPDHRAAARLVRRALSIARHSEAGRVLPDAHEPDVWLYEVWTPLQAMDEIVDISAHLETKLAAIRAHQSQCAVVRFDEAVCGLNRYRGELHSWPGGDYAEVFLRMRL